MFSCQSAMTATCSVLHRVALFPSYRALSCRHIPLLFLPPLLLQASSLTQHGAHSMSALPTADAPEPTLSQFSQQLLVSLYLG